MEAYSARADVPQISKGDLSYITKTSIHYNKPPAGVHDSCFHREHSCKTHTRDEVEQSEDNCLRHKRNCPEAICNYPKSSFSNTSRLSAACGFRESCNEITQQQRFRNKTRPRTSKPLRLFIAKPKRAHLIAYDRCSLSAQMSLQMDEDTNEEVVTRGWCESGRVWREGGRG